MRYRRNSEEDVKILGRTFLVSKSPQDYERYRKACDLNNIDMPLCGCGSGELISYDCVECEKEYCNVCAPRCEGTVRETPQTTRPCHELLCTCGACNVCRVAICPNGQCTRQAGALRTSRDELLTLEECPKCEKLVCNDECSVTCAACNSISCKGCVLHCAECDGDICKNCVETCSSCSNDACPQDDCSCSEGCHFCADCRSNLEKCHECDTISCSEHSSECHGCEERFCTECSKECSQCENSFCKKCAEKVSCSQCEEIFCDDCQDEIVSCTNCENFVCGTCLDDAGMAACADCGETLEICPECQKEDEDNARKECTFCKKSVCKNCMKEHFEEHLKLMPQNLPGTEIKIGSRVTHPQKGVVGTVLKLKEKDGVIKAVVEWDDETAGMFPVGELVTYGPKRRRYYR